MKKMILSSVAVICVGSAAAAQGGGNPDSGKALAEANCSQCHNIAPGGATKLFPPSFAAIAAYMHPDMVPIKIMYPDHAAIMPQFNTYMNATNLDDLVAYIHSLEE